jgi:hypothetical protein
VPDALLGADQAQHLPLRVKGEAEATLVPVSDGAAKLGQALGFRVAVVGRVARRLDQGADDVRRRGDVRVADGEGDDVYPLRPLLGDLAADLGEEVGR